MGEQLKKEVLDKLQQEAVVVECRVCIRGCTAARILGYHPYTYDRWIRSGVVTPVRVPTRDEPRGVRVYLPLEQVVQIAVKKHKRGNRGKEWTDKEVAMLRQCYAVKSPQEMERIFKRSYEAIKLKAMELGIGYWDSLVRHRLLTTAMLAKLTRRSNDCIKKWVRQGCPHMLRPTRRKQYMFDLRMVRDWLATQPQIVLYLHRDVRNRLGLKLEQA